MNERMDGGRDGGWIKRSRKDEVIGDGRMGR